MERKGDIRAAIDNAKLTTRLSIAGQLAALVLLILTIVMGFTYAGFVSSDVFNLAVIPYAIALLIAFASMIYGMLGTNASQEQEEKLLLEKRSDTRALNVEEDVRFTAGRSFDNYRRFTPYVIAVLGAVLVFVLLAVFDRGWSARLAKPVAANPLYTPMVAAVMAFLSFLCGIFFVGQSRQPAFRWLRAYGAWMLGAFAVMFVAMIVSLFTAGGMPNVDGHVARVIFWIYAILGAEFLISFVIEFYRPRTIREQQPIFESKLLSLFTEPGGVMRNIAVALDYQFGFKVSGTWLYSFMERSFFPLLLFWAVLLWAFTMVHEVGPTQVGVKERLGKVVAQPLKPGVYWSLPYPFGKVKRFSTTEIKQIIIGENHDEEDHVDDWVDDGHGHARPERKSNNHAPSQVVTWTNPHGSDENNFIVAVSNQRQNRSSEISTIALVRMMIPISYRIIGDKVMDYAYNNADPIETLRKIGEQAATEHLASSGIIEVMSTGRAEAQQAMHRRIQELADLHQLGVEITSVMILDSHPPVEEVAPAFQSVLGAMEKMNTAILEAKADDIRTIPQAESAKLRIIEEALTYKQRVIEVAKAEAERFTAQSATYKLMPGMFKLQLYLDLLENDMKDIRKYILSAGLDNEEYILNFENKQMLDLVDVDITSLGR